MKDKHPDLEYICTKIGSLCGIPIRLYEDGKLKFCYSTVYLPADPIRLYLEQILNIRSNTGYFVTQHFHYYGIVNSGKTAIIIGPARQVPADTQELRELAFRSDIPPEDTDAFVAGMKEIVPMPLESIMQVLLSVNYFLNGEKLELKDLAIREEEQTELSAVLGREQAEQKYDTDLLDSQGVHNNYTIECTLMDLIQKGDCAALDDWLQHAPAVRSGVLAREQLRQVKNTFIVTATLASRAAIRGGLDADDAFSLSDAYIQKCELLQTPDRIMNLQYHMIQDFTEQVALLHTHGNHSPLTAAVANYVRNHLSEPVSTEKLARDLHFSRPWLSKKFHEEAGTALTDFILARKIEEAQRLLRYTDKSLKDIGFYLGFSSQSHFSKVFKKYAGRTPGEYRRMGEV